MRNYRFYLIPFLVFTFHGQAEEQKPCESARTSIEKIRDHCRNKLKDYASEKHDLGIFGIRRMRDSDNPKDQPVKKDLSDFSKNCRNAEATKLKNANIITQACFVKITSQNTPFD